MAKRRVKLVVLSDVHLGTYGSHAKELLQYLKTIKPEILVLNGDIIDIWQFSKRYWPKSHMQIVKQITKMLAKGTKIYYVAGNHDELLRKFVGFRLGKLKIVNKVLLNLDGKKAWIFHGDVFDVTMQHSKWLTKLGGHSYDALIILNRMVNFFSEKMGYGKISLSKKIKDNVKSAVKYINNFEDTVADIGISNGYQYAICGHIHQPEIREMKTDKGEITYLNSGDWVENLSALEYSDKAWSLYKYQDDPVAQSVKLKEDNNAYLTSEELFENLLSEFKINPAA
ncbi:MAG: UDP-2,3-diacylglucosamine diphosphatase [Bacteroidia bacterium]